MPSCTRATSDSAAKDWLQRRKLPMVFVDQDPAKGITTINVDDHGAPAAPARRRLPQHVVDLGHRRVAIVSITPGHPQRERMAGWLEVLEAAGIEPAVTHVVLNDEDEAFEIAAALLGGRRPPDRGAVLLRRHRRRRRARRRTAWGSSCPTTSRSSASTTARSPAVST